MAKVPELPHGCNSWTVVDRSTGRVVAELYGQSLVEKINFEKYEVITTSDWLCRLSANEKTKGNL